MRPTPAEVIAGVRRILKDVVEPEVGSEYARSRLREIRAVLAQVDWDDAAFHLRRECDSLQDQLVAARSWIAAEPQRLAAFEQVPQADGSSEPQTFAELNSARRELAAHLVTVLDALADWIQAHQDDDSARELRTTIAESLRA
jgi:hypothetical protein